MTDSTREDKERDRQIAQNENARRITGAIRISGWAIAVAVCVIGLAAFGWAMVHR